MDDLLSRVWSILPSTGVRRKSAYGRCGGCSEKLPRLADPFLWLLTRELGEFVYAAEPLVCYRETPIARLADKYESGHLPLFRLLSGPYGLCAVRLIKDISDYFAPPLVGKALEEMARRRLMAALRDAARALVVSPGYIFRPNVRVRILAAQKRASTSIFQVSKATKVLITGSCGLIGSELSGYFCRAGHPVTGIDKNMRVDFFGLERDASWILRRLKNSLPNEYTPLQR
jgi:hypothetical protein